VRAATISEPDRADPRLKTRLEAHKVLARAETRLFGDAGAYAKALAAEVRARHVEGTLSIVVVNRVARAQEVFRALAKTGVPTRLIHSRFRPAERRAIQREALAGTFRGVIVATQAIEAGVDVSARTLFTEIAPWPSLVQRFGRCNRAGEWGDGEARVFVVDAETPDALDDDLARPYARVDVDAARAKLAGLVDAGPRSLEAVPLDAEPPALPVIRRRDLLELFDTEPDLAGHDVDVGRFVRASVDRDVQVFWRDFGDAPPADMPRPHRDELCAAPLGKDLDKLIKESGAWRWDPLERAWRRVETLFPGLVIALPRAAGGYDAEVGWTAAKTDTPPALAALAAMPEDDDDTETLTTEASDYYLLSRHSADVARELRALRNALAASAVGVEWEALERAARWHDVGKAHPVFQRMLTKRLPADDPRRSGGPWAKSAKQGAGKSERRFFRHELASALAYLEHSEHGSDDLGAFLIAAHHGKVRLSLKPRPQEKGPADSKKRFAFGVHDGDALPAVDIGDGQTTSAVTLTLELMELGDHGKGPSWADRCRRLLDKYGPFRLAYWEALIRIADWRASKKANNVEVDHG
jgi:CRISPR-associated endonuclease/helicase Cas3